ncbi:hypothetical protein ACHAWX_004304 [Stephanocyclus meneghinianus]
MGDMKPPRDSLACALLAKQAYSSSIHDVNVGRDMRKLEDDCGGGSTGMDWCAELSTCILPWEENCPIIDGNSFSGPTALLCDAGRCSSEDECMWTDGSAQFGTYYFTDLDGEFDVPDGCILNCTGCVLVGGNNSSTMPGQNPVGTLEDTSASKGLSMNACVKLIFFVTQSAVNIGLSFFQ